MLQVANAYKADKCNALAVAKVSQNEVIFIANDSQSRKWQITINNPLDKEFNHSRIMEELAKIKSCIYWVLSDEIGATHHTHIYIACSSAVRFSTLKNRFPEGHLEIAHGDSIQNRDYVFKLGKWLEDKKHETNLPDTHKEYGEMPIERKGTRNDLSDLYDMIKQGMTNYDILEESPDYMLQLDKIERVRQTVREEKFKNTFRQIETIYIWGITGVGKTRSIMEQYGYENIFRVTDYTHPFDTYKGQDIIIFEEFRSSIKISDMLIYLEGYPTELPCRYTNKVACFTKVYLITNIDLCNQYEIVQLESPNTWQAFLRRIKTVKYYQSKNNVQEYNTVDYISGFYKLGNNEYIPFNK